MHYKNIECTTKIYRILLVSNKTHVFRKLYIYKKIKKKLSKQEETNH